MNKYQRTSFEIHGSTGVSLSEKQSNRNARATARATTLTTTARETLKALYSLIEGKRDKPERESKENRIRLYFPWRE